MAKRVAVIDIGSNSIRMVVYERTSRYAFHLLHEEKSKVRLSENAYMHDGNIQDVPMQRTYSALANFIQISKSFKVRKLLCVATSALRDAPNQKIFLTKIKEELKLNVKVISGEQEAYYGAIACANLLPKQKNALSIDIGGGSTEFSLIDEDNVSDTISLKLGTVRLKELYFDNNDIDGAVRYIDKELDKLQHKRLDTLIGIGGTFRAISNAIQKRDEYPLNKIHAYQFGVDKLQKYIDKLLCASHKELDDLGIKENRYDVIKPGALIIQRVLLKLDISKIITSGVGVREGVYLSDLLRNSKHKFPHNYNTSVKCLLDSYGGDTHFSSQLNLVSKKLFDLTSERFNIKYKYRYELGIAAKLFPIGSSVHFYSQNKHTYYLIQNALEYGFSHETTTLIATLTKYAKNRLPAHSHLETYAELLPKINITNYLSYILSLSITLLSHRPRNIDFELSFEKDTLFIKSTSNLYIAKYATDKLECSIKEFKVKFNS